MRATIRRNSITVLALVSVLLLTGLAPALAESAAPDADWLARVARDLEAREYEFSAIGADIQAPNRQQDLRATLREGGVVLAPRREPAAATSGDASWTWSWRTVGFGRGESVADVPPVAVTLDGARVEFRHAGFTEWWENRPEGLEQGFTIASRPGGSGALRIEGVVPGSLVPRLAAADRIDFVSDAGTPVLTYDALVAVDARGAVLPSHLDVDTDRVVIVVDDAGAVYPVIVDPLVSDPALADGQSGSHFGVSVSAAGDVDGDGYGDVIVGAPDWDGGHADEGKVFLWYGSANGLAIDPDWSWEPNVTNERVGASVSMAGDVNGDGFDDIIAGAPSHSSGLVSQGAAYVWTGARGGPAASPDWELLGGSFLYELGTGVSDAGDVNADGYDDILVGVRGWTAPELWEGAVLLYLGGAPSHGDASGLGANPTVVTAAWTFESNEDSVRVAYAIGTAGDVNADGYDDVIIGAPDYDGGHGSAWIFHGGPSDLGPDGTPLNSDWSMSAFVNVGFGAAVAGLGDVDGDGYGDIAVGIPRYSNGESEEGWVGVYHGAAAGTHPLPLWQYEGGSAGARFGESVSTAGDVDGDGFADMLVGAPTEDGPLGQVAFGRAYLFEGGDGGLAPSSSLVSYGDQSHSQHGADVAAAGDVDGDGYGDVLIGAPSLSAGGPDTGQVTMMRGTPDGLAETPGWTVQSNQVQANFGLVVASAGDVDADGYSDVLVGAPKYDAGEVDEGVVFFYRGGPGGLAGAAAWTAQSNQAGAELGQALDGAGDVNGDGYDDVILGAPFYTDDGWREGAAFVWFGSAADLGTNGLPANADVALYGDQDEAAFGRAVAGIGDVNGDGYHEVAIGAPQRDGAGVDAGAVDVHPGGPGGTSTTATWSARSDEASDAFGIALDSAGDVNGDGFSDLVVGAGSDDDAYVNEGAVYVWLGSPTGFGPSGTPSNADWVAHGGRDEARLGDAVSTAGDVNADGYSDLIAGAWGWTGGITREGQARVWLGGAGGLAATPAWDAAGGQTSAYLGFAVSEAGDLDGDGFDDVIVGVPRWNGAGGLAEGEVRVYPGGATGPGTVPLHRIEGGQAGALFGWSVAGQLDLNGDGFGDVVASAPTWTDGQTAEGHAFAFLGNGGGLDRIPRQRGPALQPLALLGVSSSEAEFRIHTRARNASGRTRVRMQWEVKPYGTPFDGTYLTTQSIAALTLPPDPSLGSYIDLGLPANGLLAATYYHWRVRIVSANPRFPRTPWFTIPGNGASERDLRTAGTIIVGVQEPIEVVSAGGLSLAAPWPNPSSSQTTIRFEASGSGPVQASIYDLAGRRIRRLSQGYLQAGGHRLFWDGRSDGGRTVAAGVYLVRVSTATETSTARITLIR